MKETAQWHRKKGKGPQTLAPSGTFLVFRKGPTVLYFLIGITVLSSFTLSIQTLTINYTFLGFTDLIG